MGAEDRSPAGHEAMLGALLGCPQNPVLGDFNPAEVSVVQYLRPDGRKRMMRVDVGQDFAQRARDAELVLTAETLPGGMVAIYARRRQDPEEDERVVITSNGPGPNQPDLVLRRLIEHLAPTPSEAEERQQAALKLNEWHKARIESAARFAHENPHLVDDYSDADPGL